MTKEAGRSMGILDGIEATDAAIRAMEAELSAMLYIHHPDRREQLISIAEREKAGEILSLNEVALLAEAVASVVFDYSLQYVNDFVANDPNGEEGNYSIHLYRMVNFYRMVEFLRISRVLREDIDSRDKLFLGAGSVVEDIFPFVFRFKIKDMVKYLANPPGMVPGVEHTEHYRYLEAIGAVGVKKSSGRVVVVDDDEWLLGVGATFAERMRMDIEAYSQNARQFLDESMGELSQRLDIGLLAAVRLDPELLGEAPFKGNVYRRSAESFIRSVSSLMDRADRQVLVTIGSGKGPDGYNSDYRLWPTYKARMVALWRIEDGLSQLGPIFRADVMRWDLYRSWQYPQVSDLEVLVVNSDAPFLIEKK
jgi:hypothetical protein